MYFHTCIYFLLVHTHAYEEECAICTVEKTCIQFLCRSPPSFENVLPPASSFPSYTQTRHAYEGETHTVQFAICTVEKTCICFQVFPLIPECTFTCTCFLLVHTVQFAQWRKPAFVFSTAGLPRNSPSFQNVLLPALVFPLFTHTLCVRGENTQWKKKRKIALFSHCRFVSPYPRCTLIFTCFLLVNTHRYSAGDPTDKDSSAELEEK